MSVTKEAVMQNKEEAIKSLNRLLESFIDDPNHLKKANLISYWLKTYVNYIKFEEQFDPSRLIRYPRGSVVRLDFGFNIGKEFGGLHFAVVIDNDNKRNADVLTVIPLSSTDGKTVHPRNVDLGIELFQKINDVQKTLYSNAREELNDLQKAKEAFVNTVSVLEKIYNTQDEQKTSELTDQISAAIEYINEIEDKESSIKKTIEYLTRNKREIAKLKTGSMAVVNQITTISKQRIFTPKRSEDFLYGIKLSPSAMEKINDKLKELYIH